MSVGEGHDASDTRQERRYVAHPARNAADIDRARQLRARAFGLGREDIEAYDACCTHVLVEDRRDGRVIACFRLRDFSGFDAAGDSYAAQFYDLAPLAGLCGRITELGRFCIEPGARDPDILRAAWGAITAHVDAADVALLFGCTSFAGTDPARYRDAFAFLAEKHIAPAGSAPGRRAPQTVLLRGASWNSAAALAQLPPLLRTYLRMGGWVSDHAVIDPDMNTIHVFTGLEIARIPEARKRRLRSALDGGGGAR